MVTPTEQGKKIKVLMAKSDMDAHDKGIRYIAQVLLDGGIEVIIMRYRSTEEVVSAAIQEDVDVLGLSFYSAGYLKDTEKVLKSLGEKGKDDIRTIIGGIIPKEDVPRLLNMGIAGVFGPGVPATEVIGCITSAKQQENNSISFR